MADRFRESGAGRDRGGLERRYRRLLACYPVAYRRVHEEEMLAVLMTAAPDRQRRPQVAEVADLIWGALRVRCQPSRNGTEPAWRDALAVLSVILPLIALLIFAVWQIRMLQSMPGVLSYGFPWWALEGLTVPLALVAMGAVALQRRRRVTALAVAALLIGLVYRIGAPGFSYAWGTADADILLVLGLQMAAVTASPGPRRGLQLLTWRHAALSVIAALTIGATIGPVTLVVIAGAVLCAAMALASSLARWLLILLAIPAWPFLFPPGAATVAATAWAPLVRLHPELGFITQAYLPPAVLLAVLVIAACRDSHRSPRLPAASR